MNQGERLTALIAEDDFAQKQLLIRFAEEHHLIVVDTVSSGSKLVDKYVELQPDLILTDISLDGISGLEACRRIKTKGYDPCIIVVTALTDMKYAEESFEIDSLSLMLKPVTTERFKKSLEKAKKHLMQKRKQSPAAGASGERLVRCKQKICDLEGRNLLREVYINEEQILYITKERKHISIKWTDCNSIQTLHIASTLKELNKITSPCIFQCNKSQLVNIKYVRKLCADLLTPGNYEILLHNVSESLTLSRSCYAQFEQARSAMMANRQASTNFNPENTILVRDNAK